MLQPTPVAPVDPKIVLDEDFANNRVAYMKELGAQNVDAPLPRSAFLKNIKTGVVLPWTLGLAGMRDIMVNCDAEGNTDPVAWAASVDQRTYSQEEQQQLLDQAKSQLIKQMDKHRANMPQGSSVPPNDTTLPYGAERMDVFLSRKSNESLDQMAQLLE